MLFCAWFCGVPTCVVLLCPILKVVSILKRVLPLVAPTITDSLLPLAESPSHGPAAVAADSPSLVQPKPVFYTAVHHLLLCLASALTVQVTESCPFVKLDGC